MGSGRRGPVCRESACHGKRNDECAAAERVSESKAERRRREGGGEAWEVESAVGEGVSSWGRGDGAG